MTARRDTYETLNGSGSGNAGNLAVIIGRQMEAEIKFLSPIGPTVHPEFAIRWRIVIIPESILGIYRRFFLRFENS